MDTALSGILQVQDTVSCDNAAVEEIRRKYLNHEICVKSVGMLYFIGSFLLLLVGIIGPIADTEDPIPLRIAISAFLISLSAFQFLVAGAIRKLKSWARIAVGVLSGIGLLAFPLGTVINAYILYLIFCRKGEVVFAPQYKQVIAATPHIKYKTSIVVWLLLGTLAALLAFMLLSVVLAN